MAKCQTLCKSHASKKTVCMQKEKYSCDDYIDYLDRVLPESCTAGDLIKHGIFKSHQSLANNRKNRNCPFFIKYNTKVFIYPKKGVLEYVREKISKMAA